MSFVHIQNLRKSYGNILAVDDFSLSINQGEIYALVGPDGAGKTTIMRALCHLIKPDEGTLHVGEYDVAKQFEQIKDILGYMPQTFSLYGDLSIRENLRFYGGVFGVTGERFEQRCEQLYNFSNLKAFAGRRAQFLSGGMKQKLALSCALIHDPGFLALDEPTTGVDPLSRQQFWELLFQLRNQGVTILVSTPYMDEVAHSDRACFIFKGKVLAQGTPEQLVKMFQGLVYYYDKVATPDVLEKLNELPGLTVRRFGGGLHFYVDTDEHLNRYREQLNQAGFDHDRFQPIDPDLEDCFIQMMGGDSE